MDIAINRANKHVTLTMKGYIDRLLRRVRPNGIKGASTPATYTPPNYANPQSQKATVDTSALASESEKKLLQSVVGTLLYYSRAVDPSICTAVHELGTVQSKPTVNDMQKMERLLQYVSKHRNIGIRCYASNMALQNISDASYLSRPKARSVCGWFSYLGLPSTINGPISVYEAEMAGGFQAAQTAVHHRRILADLGYPQPATLLRMDNTVTLGIASGTMNAKRAKSMDMRFFWLVDRVRQQQFVLQHIPGTWNIADHFTKPLPKNKFYQLIPFLCVNMDNEPQEPQLKVSTVTLQKEM
jgi:hypothetical protein